MENNASSFKENIFEKISSDYKRIEELESEKEARKATIFYRRKGYYFAFCMPVGGKWRVYIE